METNTAQATPKIENPSFEKYVQYRLNWEVFGPDICKVTSKADGKNPELKMMKFSEVIGMFMEKEITSFKRFPRTTVVSEGIQYEIKCEGVCESLLPILLGLMSKKIGIDCTWYFYDMDYVIGDFHERYIFFLVGDTGIVNQAAAVTNAAGSLLNPNFLTCDNEHIWNNSERLEKAWAQWYYQKFYETEFGQVVKIRDSLDDSENPDDDEDAIESKEMKAFREMINQSKTTNALLVCMLIAMAIFLFYR